MVAFGFNAAIRFVAETAVSIVYLICNIYIINKIKHN